MNESKMIPTKTQFDLCQERCEMDCEVCKKSRWVSVDVLRQKLQARIKSLQEWTKFDSNPQSTGYLRAFSQIDILKELLVELEQKEARP